MSKTICIYYLGGGNIELISKKISYWSSKGISIKLICPEFEIKEYRKLINGINYLPIPFSKPTDNKFIFIIERMKRIIFTCFYLPQIINSHVIYSISSVLDAILLPFFIKLFYSKITWTVLYENHISLKGKGNFFVRLLAVIFHKISRLLIKKADNIFVVTKSLKDDLTKSGFDKKKLVLTGNPIDSHSIKKALGQKGQGYDALFMGRIDPQKGVFDLVEITKKVIACHPNFQLAIAGKGVLNIETQLAESIQKQKLEKNIELVGHITGQKKYQMLVDSKIFILPSYKESFGVALLEAVCSGTKAIAYDLPIYSLLYTKNEIIKIPVGDIEQFSKKIVTLLNKNDFFNSQGVKLLNSNKFSYERISKIEFNNFFL